jgi:hypothetical protein
MIELVAIGLKGLCDEQPDPGGAKARLSIKLRRLRRAEAAAPEARPGEWLAAAR